MPIRPDPYCRFRDDHERRLALRSRDIRLVLITVISAIGAVPATTHTWPWLLAWFH